MRNQQQTKWNNYDCAGKFATLQLSRIQSLAAIQPTFDAKGLGVSAPGERRTRKPGLNSRSCPAGAILKRGSVYRNTKDTEDKRILSRHARWFPQHRTCAGSDMAGKPA